MPIITSPKQSQPSYAAGYAKSASESANPELWEGLNGAWVPNLGFSGESIPNVGTIGEAGVLTNMDPSTDWVVDQGGIGVETDGVNDGQGDRIRFGIQPELKDFSIIMKLSIPSWTQTDARILEQGGYNVGFSLTRGGSGSALMCYVNSSPTTSTTAFPLGRTVNLAYIRKFNQYHAFYFDGEFAGAGGVAGAGTKVAQSSQMEFTARLNTSSALGRGTLHSLCMYDRALSYDEVLKFDADPLAPFRQRKSVPYTLTSTPPVEEETTGGLIRLKSPGQTQPSYKAGYAKSASESAYPELWDGLRESVAFGLGITGNIFGQASDIPFHEIGTGSAEGFVPTLAGFEAATLKGQPSYRFDKDQAGAVYCSDNGRLDFEDETFTVAAWVHVESSGSTQTILMKAAAFDYDAVNYFIGVTGSEFSFGVSASDGGTSEKRISGGTVELNTWHFVAGVHRSGGEMGLFVDGVPVATGTAVAATASNSGDLVLGGFLKDNTALGFEGCIHSVYIYGRELTAKDQRLLIADPLAPFRQRRTAIYSTQATTPPSNEFTLTAETGSFAIAGNDAGLTYAKSYSITAETGSFALAGNDVDLDANRKLTADAGSFVLTGNSATLTKTTDNTLNAGTGPFTLDGNDSGLKASRKAVADTGSFALNGIDSALKAVRKVSVNTGEFNLGGNNAELTYTPTSPSLVAGTGEFALSGNDASLVITRRVAVNAGEFTLNGFEVGFKLSRSFTAATGAFDLGGEASNLIVSRSVVAGTGEFLVVGSDVRIRYSEEGTTSLIQIKSAFIQSASAAGSITGADSNGSIVTP